MNTNVVATKDFTVGPSREVVIAQGQTREVRLCSDGVSFSTVPDSGYGWFGMCKIGEGWEVIRKDVR